MSEFVIYHNPRCSKSRQTLAILEQAGIEPTIIEYLKEVPTVESLKEILVKLNIPALELVRSKEAEYKQLELKDKSETELLAAMHQYPKLIERPVVVCGAKAVIGRPPENVLALMEK